MSLMIWLRFASKRLTPIALTGLLASSLALPVVAASPEAACSSTYTESTDVPATMRDGTILRANVFTPAASGTFPVILLRLPYDKEAAQTYVYGSPGFYASQCYVVVVQDVRGQYKSDGTFYTFRDEATDGYDTIEWAAGLPKANGKVGMYGFSYPGASQWLAAALRPPHLVTIIPAMTSSDYHDGWTYEGGALDLSFAEDWPMTTIANSAVRHYPDGAALDAQMNQAVKDEFTKTYFLLPLKDFPPLHPEDPRVAPYFFDWLRHPDNDAYWQEWSIRSRYDQITVPALNFDGWYDIFINGALENFNGMRKNGGSEVARNGQRLVVGPWLHLPWSRQVGQIDFGPEANNPIDQLQLRWFDFWLKGISNGVDKDPMVRIFVMGANKWRTATEWPVPGTVYRKYYLHSQGSADTAFGDGWLSTKKPKVGNEAATDRYQYDPANPVPSIGGRFQASVPGGPYDQRPLLERPDVLVYTTPPLEGDIEVTGPITVTLYASSSATDTDWVAKLDDVYPDGTSMLIEYGVQRARYRDSETNPTLIKPGEIYKYTIHIWPTSNLFKAGHQIRLEISSSNFPMYDRNPNTGHPFAQDADLQVAHQTIYHNAGHPSEITLPIVSIPIEAPAGTESAALTGSIDVPAEGAIVTGDLVVGGWARIPGLDLGVTVLIDGAPRVAIHEVRVPRPDVQAAIPSLGDCSTAGYEISFAFQPGDAGEHELSVVFQGPGDLVRHYPSRKFTWKKELTSSVRACADLTQLTFEGNTSITAATAVTSGSLVTPPNLTLTNLPAFCRVQGTSKPTSDSNIYFEVWLPSSTWNGKFLSSGEGGYAGALNYTRAGLDGGLDELLRRGYATASTDTGHVSTDQWWAVGHPEKAVDYLYRSKHLVTVAAKGLIKAFYGTPASHSYFNSCSNGGRQGLMEVERYPDDYDGVVVGAPWNFQSHSNAGFVWDAQALSAPGAAIPASKLPAIEAAVLAACDGADGLGDGVIADPSRCAFDPAVLLCQGAETNVCLTQPQLAALRKIYAGPTNPRTGERIFPGFALGGEAGWAGLVANTTASGLGQGYFANLVFENPTWDYRTFNFDSDMAYADFKVGIVGNPIDPDLSAAKKRKVKIIQYHGWADQTLQSAYSPQYYESVVSAMGGLSKTQKFYRLFMVPGMTHCYFGPGATSFGGVGQQIPPVRDPTHDIQTALEHWVEDGVAPEGLIATKYVDDAAATRTIMLTRPLCLYPLVPRYKGIGNPNDAKSFVCGGAD